MTTILHDDAKLTALKLSGTQQKVSLSQLSNAMAHQFIYRALGAGVTGFVPKPNPEYGTITNGGDFYGPFVGQKEGVALLSYCGEEFPIKSLIPGPLTVKVKTKSEEVEVILSGSLDVNVETGNISFKLEFEIGDKISGTWDIFVSLPKLPDGKKRTTQAPMALKRTIKEDKVDWMAWPTGGCTPFVDLTPGIYTLVGLGERTESSKYPNSYNQSGTLIDAEGVEIKVFIPAKLQTLFVKTYALPEGGIEIKVGKPLPLENGKKQAVYELDPTKLVCVESTEDEWSF